LTRVEVVSNDTSLVSQSVTLVTKKFSIMGTLFFVSKLFSSSLTKKRNKLERLSLANPPSLGLKCPSKAEPSSVQHLFTGRRGALARKASQVQTY
jgi:hypothetical protein